MKRMMTLVLALVLCLSMCAVPASADESAVYRTLYSGEVSSLNYLTTATTAEFSICANVVDTLVEHDQFGNVVPCLAESWDNTKDDGRTWTFTLRQGVQWVDHNGEVYAELTAEDFVTAAKYILDAKNASSTAWILTDYIEGAEAYSESTAEPEEGKEAPAPFDWENVGIKAIDKYTIAYTTTEPCSYFLSMLDYVCYMPVNAQFLEEKGDQFGQATGNDNLLYCGAYIISEFKPQEKRVLTKNEKYWDAEHVYIDVIESQYNKEAGIIAPQMYLDGKLDSADISSALAAEWLADETKADMIHPVRQLGQYSYFFTFNFKPTFDAEYNPETWAKVANNENFRKSFFYGLNRVAAKTVYEKDNPEDLINDTIFPKGVVSSNGVDYTEIGDLANIKVGYDADLARQYRDAAIAELTAEGVEFPVKVMFPYNSSSSDWAEECQVIEQQLETDLGTDYIDIIVVGGPSSGFLNNYRRNGNYAFERCNWGLDFADPVNLTDPFKETDNYAFLIQATQEGLADGYYELLNAAKAMPSSDMQARYEAFAAAEAYLIDHAVIIPYGSMDGGYTASRLNTFEGQFSATGLATERFKGMHLLEKPMSTDEYYDAMDAWEEARAAQAAAE
ncbi:MAG: peptide ABC transporter substrate-binding protein [Clostridia bacterium]|nr:peptide ABC transporter substrate-binding protein [Clostridia bacterium]